MKTKNREKEIKKFFNERIRKFGYDKFPSEIGKGNFAGQAILQFLKSSIDAKNRKILDAGCGEGRFSRYFIESGANIVSMDFSEEYINLDKKNIKGGKFVVGSVTSIPFPDSSFDYVFTVDVLQHVPELKKALSEFRRVLKKGGTLIIVDKNKWGLNPRFMIPQIFIQKYRELTQWRYSEFRERWFVPEKFRRTIGNYFNDAKYTYIVEKNKRGIFRKFPKLNFFTAWTAKK